MPVPGLTARRMHGDDGTRQALPEGITLLELADLFSTEDAARKWFETTLWPTGERACDGS